MAEVLRVAPSERYRLAPLLDPRLPQDALVAYYGLQHPADRVAIHGYYQASHAPSGFLALAQTGYDLFRPLAVPFVGSPIALQALLKVALQPGRPVMLLLPSEQRAWAEEVVDLSEARVTEVWRLSTKEFRPEINVLVVPGQSPTGLPRFEVRSGEAVRAAAGVNWKGELFAEVYVESQPEAAGRGHRRSALAAIAGQLLSEGRLPLYQVDERDLSAQAEAQWIGFRPTGVHCLLAQALLRAPASVPSESRSG
jgi:hypothetical protein